MSRPAPTQSSRSTVLRSLLTVLMLAGLTQAPGVAGADEGWTVRQEADGVTVKFQGQTFTRYVLGQGNKPFLWPVHAPDGRELTRAYPMETVEGEQHDHPHHRSIWFGHQGVDGFDTWHEPMTVEERKMKPEDKEKMLAGLAPTVHRTFKEVRADAEHAVIVSVNDYVTAEGRKLMADERRIEFRADGANRIIDYQIVLKAEYGDVNLEDKKDAGFSVRVPTSMSVDGKPGGHVLNSNGDRDGDAWGKRAEWVDYYGPVKGETWGVALFNHPTSFRHPTPWHVRTYGLFTANPFGTRSLDKKAPDGAFVLRHGGTLTLRHRVVFHPGDTQAAQIAAMYEEYAR